MSIAPELSKRVSELLYTFLDEPNDTPKMKAGKIQFILTMLVGIPVTLIWAVIYSAYNEGLFALIISANVPVSLCLLILLRLRWIRFYQVQNIFLGTNLISNFFGTLILGGLANSTGNFLYILGSPFGKITASTREFLRWFGASLGFVTLEIILQPLLRPSNNIPLGASNVLWGMNFFFMCGFLFTNLIALLRQRDNALEELDVEREKSENLLLNVLPQKIADQLKREPGTIAEAYESVTILFADIVGFTPLSTQLDPTEMIDLLNEIYSKFDVLSEKFRVEKIRTIGDNYMAAAGVPEPDNHHARNIAQIALEMQEYANRLSIKNEIALQFRIGINTGSVIAGIVGKKKFQYDIWGDAVNTASRMETHGEAGKIQVTQDTFELLKEEFILEPRGSLEVKGKGQMDTWYLLGYRN